MADISPDVEEVKAILAEDRFLRSLAGSLLGYGPDADDAVQHAWLSRIENPPREPGALRAFLSRIVRNRVLNLRRAERRRSRHERAAAHPEALPSAEAMVAQEELRRRVGAAVLDRGRTVADSGGYLPLPRLAKMGSRGTELPDHWVGWRQR